MPPIVLVELPLTTTDPESLPSAHSLSTSIDSSFVGYSSHTQNSSMSMESEESEEHPLMVNIRDTITRYRLQSAAHFDVNINVKQAFRVKKMELTRGDRLNVLFIGWHESESYVCRPAFRKHARKKIHIPTAKVQIYDNSMGGFVCLPKFLDKHYPIFPDSVRDSQVQAWWAANGRIFDWAQLPTELKEHALQYCIDQKYESREMQRIKRRYDDSFGAARFRGIHEIVDKLSAWTSLLGVSHQVRAITLRLCFAGTSETGNYGAFGLSASSGRSLGSALRRLGRFYQMTEPNSLPFDFETQTIADYYKQHPRIYAHLTHYATFRHGLRRIYLNLGFIGSMQFLQVTMGRFDEYLIPGDMSYEVFEQLPNLNKISLRLPGEPQQGWKDRPGQQGPLLFYNDAPCPRLLHRVIYERIAEVLTLYPCVVVTGFMDDDEWIRYRDLRKTAVEARTWTHHELAELYEECGGGVELDEPVLPGSWIVEAAEEQKEDVEEKETELVVGEASAEEEAEAFFPPKCRCEVQCHKLFDQKERIRRRY
ncbi:hypothetical protein DE146DRAFT_779221 [Phaeosphaeria sp. MPI-PUGE-AT-0046c]|nr:hypothetical protein DE146DRAFT_779221 [Phaeosphaeria sp. MPI-PUGE-AT-0046c]